ncbi:hypothetical protein SEVIR_8G122750v4 [Setaria viridis]
MCLPPVDAARAGASRQARDREPSPAGAYRPYDRDRTAGESPARTGSRAVASLVPVEARRFVSYSVSSRALFRYGHTHMRVGRKKDLEDSKISAHSLLLSIWDPLGRRQICDGSLMVAVCWCTHHACSFEFV